MKSVVNQSYSNLEIILVDDGAKDQSGKKCDEWALKDERISVIHKSNGGLSSARNAGLDVVTGDYIMFVDSDDIIDHDLCTCLYEAIVGSNSDIAICDAEHIFNDNYHFSKADTIEYFDAEGAISEMWYQKSFLPSAWGKLYKAELFREQRFTINRLFEDIDIMHEVFWNADKVVYVKAKLYGYVHREASITTTRFSHRDLDILIIADKMIDFASDKSLNLKKAAEAYSIVAALRVYLNAPRGEGYQDGVQTAANRLRALGKKVMKDRNIRKKTLFALILYFYCRPIMRVAYKCVNRW